MIPHPSSHLESPATLFPTVGPQTTVTVVGQDAAHVATLLQIAAMLQLVTRNSKHVNLKKKLSLYMAMHTLTDLSKL